MKLRYGTSPPPPPPLISASSEGPKKQRRCWSPELHRLFVDALDKLGGSQAATLRQIKELMKVHGLTKDEVKSHLQKYRLQIRRVPNTNSYMTKAKLFSIHDIKSSSDLPGLTAGFGLFAWSGVLLATAGLVMLYRCSSKDPGFIKMNVHDSPNMKDDEPLLKVEIQNPALLSGNWSQLCITCKVGILCREVRDEPVGLSRESTEATLSAICFYQDLSHSPAGTPNSCKNGLKLLFRRRRVALN